MLIKGDRTNYGQALGILMLDTVFPRIPGDVGNALTFNYPVRFKTVKDATPQRVVKKADPELVNPFIEAAQELEREGVLAITTSCGFLAAFQEHLADAVSIPVFTSSLMQVPLVYRMLKKGQKVGIMTASKPHLSELHFKGAGIMDIPVSVYGMENEDEFPKVFLENSLNMDTLKVEAEMVKTAQRMINESNDIGAIVFECTNMPPFRKAVIEATNLPVFDIITLCDYIYSSVASFSV